MTHPRYFTTPTRPRAWVSDEVYVEPMINVPTVCDHEATDTGLVDANGDTIWRAPNPVGFLWGGEL
ncbi:hypothetical protein [Novosphingobium sp. KN65.2]|uniref:hypothetical protein n=1 Tax=Novosphingobium sp. KN65.2 TaxID=1478134 RepID=UPI0005DB8C1B|nr:hypothetical protein [Novosphingobium sp. KN65.2]CDO37129.1 hypothetical protein SPHV1_290002 [Novosphingobium sp. KN65.2]